MRHFDVIVLGVGGMGSAACCHLARRGLRVLGLEQFRPAHALGSSHGQTRIIRRAYFEHADYVPLVSDAYSRWHELELETDSDLLRRPGLVLIGPPESTILRSVQATAFQHQLAIETLSREQARERFEALNLDEDHHALFEPDAGYLRVERAVLAHMQAAARYDAVILTGQRVLSWTASPLTVTVETQDGSFAASRLVVTAGAWSARILRELGLPLTVKRMVQLWFPTDNPAHDERRGLPVFAYTLPDGFFYGFPAIDPGQMKVAEHTGGEPIEDPGLVDRSLRPADMERVQRFVSVYLPGVRPLVQAHSVCLYTMTPDEHFIIDRHPDHENVFFAAGFSGHGFKFAPTIGAALADLVVQGRTTLPIEFLSMQRAALQRPKKSTAANVSEGSPRS